MKAISLHQPHASLVAFGEKRNETRCRSFQHAGPLAIASTQSKKWLYLCDCEPFKSALERHGITDPDQLPLGKVLCVVTMMRCIPARQFIRETCRRGMKWFPQELAFGDYDPGRFCYEFAFPIKLVEPVPVTGRQFVFELPADVAERVSAQMP